MLLPGFKVWDRSRLIVCLCPPSLLSPWWSNILPSRPLYLQCRITSLFCSCQVKVLLRMHRIHTIMSSDRMSTPSPLLPPLHPPAPIQLSLPVYVMSPSQGCSLCRAHGPVDGVATRRQHSLFFSPFTCPFFFPALPDMTDLSSHFYHSCTIVWYFPCPSDTSDLLGNPERAALSKWPLAVFDHRLSYRCLHDS